MSFDKVFNVLGSLVVVAAIATLVTNASGTSSILTAFGGAFSKMLTAAEGKG